MNPLSNSVVLTIRFAAVCLILVLSSEGVLAQEAPLDPAPEFPEPPSDPEDGLPTPGSRSAASGAEVDNPEDLEAEINEVELLGYFEECRSRLTHKHRNTGEGEAGHGLPLLCP